jgi:hypothetical protein
MHGLEQLMAFEYDQPDQFGEQQQLGRRPPSRLAHCAARDPAVALLRSFRFLPSSNAQTPEPATLLCPLID